MSKVVQQSQPIQGTAALTYLQIQEKFQHLAAWLLPRRHHHERICSLHHADSLLLLREMRRLVLVFAVSSLRGYKLLTVGHQIPAATGSAASLPGGIPDLVRVLSLCFLSLGACSGSTKPLRALFASTEGCWRCKAILLVVPAAASTASDAVCGTELSEVASISGDVVDDPGGIG